MSPAQPLIGIPVCKSTARGASDIPLFTLHSSYSSAVLMGGGAPLQIPHGVDKCTLRTIFDRVDGLLLAGGGDVHPDFYGDALSENVHNIDRERDEIEIALVRWALEDGKPLLAICRGIQVMNVALGGNLYQDILCDMPGAIRHNFFQRQGCARDYLAHDVQLLSTSFLGALLGRDRFSVNSLHHQGIEGLAPELTAVGRAPDDLIEAVEVRGHSFFVGVQWHPEALAPNDAIMQRLFSGLVDAARR